MPANHRSPLRVTRVEIRNWKNFTHAQASLQQRVFLVGPNASGKSNFLDVFRFLRDLVSVGGGFQEAVRRRGGVSAIRSLAARQVPSIEVSVSLGTAEQSSVWEYALTFGLEEQPRPVSQQGKQRRPVIQQETVKEGDRVLLRRPNDEDLADAERLTQTHLEQVNVNRAFRAVAEFFASVSYLHIVPQLVREPERAPGRKNDPYGADLIERIATTDKRRQKARLSRLTEALRLTVPQLRKLELWQDETGRPHLRGKYEHWRPQGAWQMEEQFSDGTLRLFGLLWALGEGNGPLLLEEPELSLHAGVVRYLPQLFARAGRQRQIMVSTHSADLLDDEGIGVDEVLLLTPSGEGTEIRSTREVEDVRALLERGMTMREAIVPYTAPKRVQQLPLFGEP